MPNEFHTRFLEHLKKLAKATEKEHPSPWTHYEGKVRDKENGFVADDLDDATSQFIAHADPNTILKMIEYIEELEDWKNAL